MEHSMKMGGFWGKCTPFQDTSIPMTHPDPYAILMVCHVPSIYPSHVSIYAIHTDPSWDMPNYAKLCQRGGQVPWARRQLAGLLQRGKVWGRSGTIDNSGHLGILIPNHNGCWWILWMNGSVHMVYLLLYCGYFSIPTNIHGVLNH